MKKIVIVLIVLISVLVAISIYWQNISPKIDGLEIVISGNSFKFSATELYQLKQEQIITIRGDEFVGWKLLDLLALADSADLQEIKLFSRDGGSLKLNATEISSGYIIVAGKKGEKFYRLIIPTDEFGQRWMKYIVRIEG